MDSIDVCPYCGSSDREYVSIKKDGNYEGFISECAKCGCAWIDWYETTYDRIEIIRNGDIHSDSDESEDVDER